MSVFTSMTCAPTTTANASTPTVSPGSVSSHSSTQSSPGSTLQGVSWSYADPCAIAPGAFLFPSLPTQGLSSCALQEAAAVSPLPIRTQLPDSDCCEEDGGSMSEDSTADGMTPTPKPVSGRFATGFSASSDSLSDLLEDLDSCLPLGFDLEDLDGDTTAAATSIYSNNASASKLPSAPRFKNPAEAAAYLKAPRGDLDMEVQRCLRTYEKSEALGETVSRWQKEGLLNEEQRQVTLKVLVHEAANRCLQGLKHRTYRLGAIAGSATPPICSIDCDPAAEEQQQQQQQDTLEDARVRIYSAWKTIEENVSSDAVLYGYQTPQRHLSCMCIFNPTLIDTSSSTLRRASTPLPCPYGENDDDRAQRSSMQQQTIRSLKLQQAVQQRKAGTMAGETPSLFLLERSSSPSSVSRAALPHPSSSVLQHNSLSRYPATAAQRPRPSWMGGNNHISL